MTVTVKHEGHPVEVHAMTAEAYGLVDGERITTSELRNIVHCTALVCFAENRMHEIMYENWKIRQ